MLIYIYIQTRLNCNQLLGTSKSIRFQSEFNTTIKKLFCIIIVQESENVNPTHFRILGFGLKCSINWVLSNVYIEERFNHNLSQKK